MKGFGTMQSEKRLDNAVLLYLFILMILAIANMIREINLVDVLYLLAIVCAGLKCFLIMHKRK